MNPKLRLIINALISLVFLGYLFVTLDTRELVSTVRLVRPQTLAATIALAFVAYLGRAGRWMVILRHGDVSISAWNGYRLTLLGVLYGMVTPGRIGEIGKVFHLTSPKALVVPSVVWEKLFDVALLELLCLPGLFILGAWHGVIAVTYSAIVLATLGIMLILNSTSLTRRLTRFFPRIERHIQFWNTGAVGVLNSRVCLVSLLGGAFFYTLMLLAGFLVASDLVGSQGKQLALTLPIIVLLGNLPFAFGGMGLREYVAMLTVTRIGIAPEIGPAFSLLMFATVTLIPGLTGLLIKMLVANPSDRSRIVDKKT